MSVHLSKFPVPKQWLRNARDYLLRKIDLRYHADSGVVVQINSFSDWIIYNDIFVRGEYDFAIHDVLSKASHNRPAVLLDLGANVGFFAARAVDILKKEAPHLDYFITLVEGSPTTYADLCKRLSKDPNFGGKTRIIHGLVGKRSGSDNLLAESFHAKNSIICGSHPTGPRLPYIDVELLVNEFDCIDLLKCDIEGAEELFLSNYPQLLSKVGAIVIELHHDMCATDRCIRIIQEAGLTEQSVLRTLPCSSVSYFRRTGGGT